jgi:inosine-uridine nucleoside N-ribohydrolase
VVRRKLIIDCDTGSDDAVAIMLAALHPRLDLVAVTTVRGNVPVENCTDNSLRALDFVGRGDIPVHQGLARPIVRTDFPLARAIRRNPGVHTAELPIPPAVSRKRDKAAVEFLIETYRAATEEIALVPVGPLSNIAAAIALDPKFVERVPEIVIMGGAHHHGNVTPSAEFNIWADPEAAASVFSAGFRRLVCVPLDATHEALVSTADARRMAELSTPAGIAAARFVQQRIDGYDANQPMSERGAAPVHDAVCVAYLVDPSVIATEFRHVAVETAGTLTVGRTVVDTNFRGDHEPNCHFAFHADRRRFVEILTETFARKPH